MRIKISKSKPQKPYILHPAVDIGKILIVLGLIMILKHPIVKTNFFLHFQESYDQLWGKVKWGFTFAHNHLINHVSKASAPIGV